MLLYHNGLAFKKFTVYYSCVSGLINTIVIKYVINLSYRGIITLETWR